MSGLPPHWISPCTTTRGIAAAMACLAVARDPAGSQKALRALATAPARPAATSTAATNSGFLRTTAAARSARLRVGPTSSDSSKTSSSLMPHVPTPLSDCGQPWSPCGFAAQEDGATKRRSVFCDCAPLACWGSPHGAGGECGVPGPSGRRPGGAETRALRQTKPSAVGGAPGVLREHPGLPCEPEVARPEAPDSAAAPACSAASWTAGHARGASSCRLAGPSC
mmetsp:Transcript_34430/g.92275  ORF Transcript_34430/g.92275 Transcript_34430/m.92275 type:complete len:224 (+) Transcript_34430:1115-1786(+)